MQLTDGEVILEVGDVGLTLLISFRLCLVAVYLLLLYAARDGFLLGGKLLLRQPLCVVGNTLLPLFDRCVLIVPKLYQFSLIGCF